MHLREVDVPGFHDAEVRADVEAPDVTSDSLGTGLEAFWPVVAPDETLEPFLQSLEPHGFRLF